jgi:hypothetical protein
MANAVLGDARSMARPFRRMLERIGELDRRGAYRAEGYTSMASWVMANLSVSFVTAKSYVEVGRALADLPELGARLGTGDVSFDQLRALVRVATPGMDAELATKAPGWSVSQTETYVREEETRRADAQRRRLAEANRRMREEQARREEELRRRHPDSGSPIKEGAAAPPLGDLGTGTATRNGRCPSPAQPPKAGNLRLRPHRDGGYLDGWLPTEEFAAIEAVLLERASSMPKDPVTGRQAPLPERLAQAFVEHVTERVGTNGDGTKTKSGGTSRLVPTLVVHADIGLLDGSADGDAVAVIPGAGPISSEVLRRLACEAKVRLAVDSNGLTLDLGRTSRFPSEALANEVLRRDEGCRFPGCSERRFLQIHHLLPWTDGGQTDLDNLAAHCVLDHRRLHHQGWEVSGHANGELRYRSPDGQVLVSKPSPSWSEPHRRRRNDKPQR